MGYKQITIVCPYFETGGPEALHQLCDNINLLGGNAFIWYYGENKECHPAYSCYSNVKITTKLRDEEQCAIVLPEGEGKMIPQVIKSQIYFWWLASGLHHRSFEEYNNSFQDERIIHLYQSYYALHYLWNKNTSRYLPLFDYINETYTSLSSHISKEDIICYNPKKGYEITSKIIENSPGLKFVPLIDMTRQQVVEALTRSKVYMDFGYHPGKDRFPREAALLNNIIVSGWRGSAMFYNDVPIPNAYKFDNDNLHTFLLNCLYSYEQHLHNMMLYQNVIRNQKEEFKNQIKQAFLQ